MLFLQDCRMGGFIGVIKHTTHLLKTSTMSSSFAAVFGGASLELLLSFLGCLQELERSSATLRTFPCRDCGGGACGQVRRLWPSSTPHMEHTMHTQKCKQVHLCTHKSLCRKMRRSVWHTQGAGSRGCVTCSSSRHTHTHTHTHTRSSSTRFHAQSPPPRAPQCSLEARCWEEWPRALERSYFGSLMLDTLRSFILLLYPPAPPPSAADDRAAPQRRRRPRRPQRRRRPARVRFLRLAIACAAPPYASFTPNALSPHSSFIIYCDLASLLALDVVLVRRYCGIV